MGVYAEDGQCVLANDAYAKLVGDTKVSLLEQNFNNIIPWQKAGLLNACQTALSQHSPQYREVTIKNSLGKQVWFECRILPAHLNNKTHLLMQFIDLTDRKNFEEELRHLAFHDSLTRLPNRRLLQDRMQQSLHTSKRQNTHVAVLFLDLNKFKQLNDTYGHDVGDQLLVEVANRLRQQVRDCDTVARIGGDEFVVLLEGLDVNPETATEQANAIAAKIVDILSEEYLLGDIRHHGSASIGIKIFSGDEADPDKILKDADEAMYKAKKGEAR